MRVRRTIWWLLVLLLLVGGYLAWRPATKQTEGVTATPKPIAAARKTFVAPALKPPAERSPIFDLLSPEALVARSNALAAARAERFRYRIANTTKTVGQLARSGTAILLENALIDTASTAPLPVPAELRAAADPGSYIVQARGPVDAAFRAQLAAAGATIVSYIPNNAYLVTAANDLRQLSGGKIQAVYAYEPQFKLKADILKLVLDQKPLPENRPLNVLLFPGRQAETIAALDKLGAKVISETRSPFGPVLTVQTPPDAAAAVARMAGVHEVELSQRRVPANDLSRVTLSVSADTLAATPNYLDLTGTNVLVGVNDSGVDSTHPDLAGHVIGDFPFSVTNDTLGHGTHVAGIIASSGSNSPPGTNASGSVTGANFRGKAPGANIFSMSYDEFFATDTYLQETAARTNVFISNNSWGYGSGGYNLAAASYDAAVRDALPDTPGSQPTLYVFSAGNGGAGESDGTGGESDSILSPATAKNVISVGALEQLRNITNLVQPSFASTNESPIFLSGSDSDNQVANYSSRGNVGVGTEGDFGRFKPDVIAPGSWVVSTRSPTWDQIAYYNPTNYHVSFYLNQTVQSNAQLNYMVFIPKNAVALEIDVYPTVPVSMPIYVSQNGTPSGAVPNAYDVFMTNFPPGTADANFSYSVGNTNSQSVKYDVFAIITTTNDNGNTYEVLSNKLNEPLGPYYRYESGTSMAAPAVSGTLALMQEFFEQRAHVTNSPALMKALLINGARSAASMYDFQVQTPINYQGWGLANLTNSLPGALSNFTTYATAPIQIFDQSPTNALATGQSHTRNIHLSPTAQNLPLRVTLVWTDPPGDPSASIKLVNDLDLIVTNLDNGDVFYGNDIQLNNNFNLPWDTNGPANVDFVNNVENVYLTPLGDLLGANYSVTVVGNRVNVNAVTAHTNDVVQDYALVISSSDGEVADAISFPVSSAATLAVTNLPLVTTLTNTFGTNSGSQTVGGILMYQRVGANTPLLGTNTIVRSNLANQAITVGMTNQWHFYVYENTTSFTNTAFATFLPPELSVPRIGVRANTANATRTEADIDLYVSTNPGLTNLDPVVLQAAYKAQGRGGTEVLTFTNGANQTYYIGVKSEDQMAAEYAFLGVASELPFGENDNGNLILRGFPAPVLIPDGTPAEPGAVMLFGIATEPITVRRVIVTNGITHELPGDLLGNLSHNEKYVVLNNHTGNDGVPSHEFIYDDSSEGGLNPPPGYTLKHSDGPGSLLDFIGEEGSGLWLFTMVDNAPGHTGQVDNLSIRLEPQLETNSITFTIQPGATNFFFVDVPPEATNLTVSISGNSQPVVLMLRHGDLPNENEYDVLMTVNPPGGQITLTRNGTPPLLSGRYYIAVYNPVGNTAQTITLRWDIGLDLNGVLPAYFGATGSMPLLDDAVTNSIITVDDVNRIYSVEVGVRIDHQRESDLALTLVSPRGTRVLLAENRGGWDTNGYGLSKVSVTNVYPTVSSGFAAEDKRTLNTGATSGTLLIDFTPFSIPDRLIVENNGILIFDTGSVSGTNLQYTINYGPGPDPNLIVTVNPGNNSNTNTAWNYTATVIQNPYSYATFTEDTTKSPSPMKFAIPPFHGSFGAGTVWSNGFEGAAAGDYLPGDVIDGWDVTSATTNDLVTVNTNRAAGLPDAHEGTNFVSFEVGSGSIARILPTITGSNYNLTFFWKELTPNGSLQVRLAGVYTNTFTAPAIPALLNTNWVYETRTFIAPSNNMRLELESLWPDGNVRVDDFTLTELPMPAYFLPEESLAALKGERANGDWKLEVWDSRAGATNLAPTLISWKLSFIYEDTAPATAFVWGTNPPVFLNLALGGSTNTIDELTTLVVTNTAVDLDVGSILSYTLLNPPAGAFISPNGIITWVPTEAQGPGVYTITTLVTDNGIPTQSVTNSFTVVVNETNAAPVLPVIADRTIDEVSTLMLVLNTATDSDIPVNPLTYTLIVTNNADGSVVTNNPPTISTNGLIAWTPTEAHGPGVYTFTTIVTDTNALALTNWVLSATNAFIVTVDEVNTPPYWPTPIPDQIVTELLTNLIVAAAVDDDRPTNVLTYALTNEPAGMMIDTNTGIITWVPTALQGPGVYSNVTVIVTDTNAFALTNQSLSATTSFTVTVVEAATNTPPYWPPNVPSQTNYTLNELTLLTVTNTAQDDDLPANPLTYTLIVTDNTTSNLVTTNLAVIDPGGIITWTPGETQGPGSYTFTTIVTDTNAAALTNRTLSATNSFTVTVNETNAAPYFLGVTADRTISPLTTLVVPDPAQDDDYPSNTLTYALLVAPTNAFIDPGTGLITWTPGTNQSPSTNLFTAVVTDDGVPPLSATNSFTIKVAGNPAGFSLMQYNVKGNGVTDWSTNAAQVQAIGRELTYLNPDIITFNEIPVDLAYEMTNWGSTFLAGYNIVVSPGNDGFIGSAIASRYPINRSDSWLDGADLNPFGYSGNFTRDLFEAEINVPGFTQPLHVFTTHLKSSAGGYADAALKRAAETAAITNFFATNFFVLYPNDPYTLSGDMNESDTNTLAIQQLVNSSIGLYQTDPTNPYSGDINTFSIQFPPPSERIDYIMPCGLLVTNIYSSLVFRTDLLSPMPSGLFTNDSSTASDHLPVLMVFGSPYLSNTPPVFVTAPTNETVLALATLVVTNAATDAEAPPQTLTYTLTVTNLLDNSLVTTNAATIDTNGVITWTPAVAQSPGTNLLTTVVTDNGSPNLSATNIFTVVVEPPPPFSFTSVVVSTNQIELGWDAPSYEQFALQWASNLLQAVPWPEFTNIITSPTTNFLFLDDGTQTGGLDSPRFYRLRLRP